MSRFLGDDRLYVKIFREISAEAVWRHLLRTIVTATEVANRPRSSADMLMLAAKFQDWLTKANACLALTTYQRGRLMFIGRKLAGGVLVTAIPTGIIARRKNRSRGLWLLFALSIPVLPLLLVWLLPALPSRQSTKP
jgi:hypothetical protein